MCHCAGFHSRMDRKEDLYHLSRDILCMHLHKMVKECNQRYKTMVENMKISLLKIYSYKNNVSGILRDFSFFRDIQGVLIND